MKKLIVTILVVLVAAGAAFAQNGTTLAAQAAAIRNNAVTQEQSVLPSDSSRQGNAVIWYDVASAAADDVTGDVEVGVEIPDNTAVVGGYIQVIEAVTPASVSTNATISLVNTGDLLGGSTETLTSEGITALVSTGFPVQVSSDSKVTLNLGSGSVTNGTIMLILDLIKFQ